MSVEISRLRHTSLVQFVGNASYEGYPQAGSAWIDDRSPASQPLVLGANLGEVLHVRLRWLTLDPSCQVRIVSRSSKVTVEPSGPVAGPEVDVTLRIAADAALSGEHEDAQLAVQWNGKSIHGMTVRLWRRLRVRVAVHRMTIGGESRAASFPRKAELFTRANEYWHRAGVELFVDGDYHSVTVPGDRSGTARITGGAYPEIVEAKRRSYLPGRLNLYVATRLGDEDGEDMDDVLGIHLTAQGCVVVRAQPDAFGLGWTLAHECGHFFSLAHPFELSVPAARRPPAARWFLMHPLSGEGCLIPLKWCNGRHLLDEHGATHAREAILAAGIVEE